MEQVLACAGRPVQERQKGQLTLFSYYREAPLLENSMVSSKASLPTVHHGVWTSTALHGKQSTMSTIVSSQVRSKPQRFRRGIGRLFTMTVQRRRGRGLIGLLVLSCCLPGLILWPEEASCLEEYGRPLPSMEERDHEARGTKVVICGDMNFFTDREASNPLNPSELDWIVGIAVRWDDMEWPSIREKDRPLDQSGLVQKYFSVQLRFAFDVPKIALERIGLKR